jgi:hypothetical protein
MRMERPALTPHAGKTSTKLVHAALASKLR